MATVAKQITKKMLECARLAASGEYTVDQLAAIYGKNPATIRNWLANDEVKAEYRAVLRASEAGQVAKARRKIEQLLDSDAGNGYLSLQAAQTVLNHFNAAVMGEEKQEVTIHITGGMPALGMPTRAEEEAQ